MAITNGLKISQLNTATELQETDFFAVARGNNTYKLQGSDVIKKIVSTARYAKTNIPAGDKTVNIVHNLNALRVNVTVFENSTDEIVYPTVTIVNNNTVKLTFKNAPTTNQYGIVITK